MKTKVTYIQRVSLPEQLAGDVGDERELDGADAERLCDEGYVTIGNKPHVEDEGNGSDAGPG